MTFYDVLVDEAKDAMVLRIDLGIKVGGTATPKGGALRSLYWPYLIY